MIDWTRRACVWAEVRRGAYISRQSHAPRQVVGESAHRVHVVQLRHREHDVAGQDDKVHGSRLRRDDGRRRQLERAPPHFDDALVLKRSAALFRRQPRLPLQLKCLVHIARCDLLWKERRLDGGGWWRRCGGEHQLVLLLRIGVVPLGDRPPFARLCFLPLDLCGRYVAADIAQQILQDVAVDGSTML